MKMIIFQFSRYLFFVNKISLSDGCAVFEMFSLYSKPTALFDAEGASTYYRMYTSSHDIVFVHTTMQLSTDKLTNRPKSLFCIHQVVG